MKPRYLAAVEEARERDPVCFVCAEGGSLELHHVIPRSHFGKNNKDDCWTPRNMVMLCPTCHRLKGKQGGAHTHAARVRHLAMLAERYGYQYDDKPWSEYR